MWMFCIFNGRFLQFRTLKLSNFTQKRILFRIHIIIFFSCSSRLRLFLILFFFYLCPRLSIEIVEYFYSPIFLLYLSRRIVNISILINMEANELILDGVLSNLNLNDAKKSCTKQRNEIKIKDQMGRNDNCY